MKNILERLYSRDLPVFLSDTELKELVDGSLDRKAAIIKRAVASGELIRLRRGLYCLSKRCRRSVLNLFSAAQRFYGPSYVSFESALAYHGWIPEAVHGVSSASVRRSRNFETPIGIFSFIRVPARIFFAHVQRIVDGDDVFFMASPWRAIADYVYVGGKQWRGIHPLVNSLRIDEEELHAAKREELEELMLSFGNRRVRKFLRGVIKDLGL